MFHFPTTDGYTWDDDPVSPIESTGATDSPAGMKRGVAVAFKKPVHTRMMTFTYCIDLGGVHCTFKIT